MRERAMTCTETERNEDIKSSDLSPDGSFVASQEPPIVVIASANPEIRDPLARLLLEESFNVILVSGLEEFKMVLEYENVVACICGFHLSSGVSRDVVHQAHRQPIEIPVVMVSAPGNANEYEEYLASLNYGAFDFVCHPYRAGEVRNVVWSAIKFHGELKRVQSSRSEDSILCPSQFESQLASLADH
jgi:DNA-binding NtrC family response regulator